MSNRNIAGELARKYKLAVRQQRYSENGEWYHPLVRFPAAFFDKNGYIVFNTREDYESCSYLQLGQDVNVIGNGISSIPGYILYNDNKEIEPTIKETEAKYGITPSETFPQEFTEGAIEEMVIELRKRNPQLKKSAVEALGVTCQVCGFNFAEFYGEIGKGYIEIHHIHPLSENDESRQTTLDDVAMVCSNCHRMLHRNGKNALPVEDLIKFIEAKKAARD